MKSTLIVLHRELTKVPHMATSKGDEQTVQFMLKRWQDPETGLDDAWREEYMVYLSFPDPKNPNKVTVGEPTSSHSFQHMKFIIAAFHCIICE